MLCFFRSLLYFDWIKCHLISGRVESGRVRSVLLFKKNRSGRIQFGRVGRVFRVGSGSATVLNEVQRFFAS
jgi:hypothetical protein